MTTALSINRVAFTLFGKEIYWYSIILAAAVLTVFILCCYRGKKKGYSEDTFIDLCFVILIPGIIGARTLYVITNWSSYADNLVSVFKIWEGGLAILGGFVLAIPCYIIYCVKKKINFWELLDIIVPCFALAQAIGRWGNFVNQELYGPIVTNPSLQFFPFAVFIDATNHWHMATFFYESVWSLMTFIVLSILSKKKHDNGDIFMLYIVFYSVIRIILDAVKLQGTLTNQLICVCMIIIVAVLFILKQRMKNNEAFSDKVHSKINRRLLFDYDPSAEAAAAQATAENNDTQSNSDVENNNDAEGNNTEDKKI